MTSRAYLVAALAATATAVTTIAACGTAPPMALPDAAPQPVAASASVPAPQAKAAPREHITYPEQGRGTWSEAARQDGGPAGREGQVMRYRVAVERGIEGVTADAFADKVTTTLEDPRSWTAGEQYRFRRVGPGQSADFVVRLATPGTRDALCDGADGYTSCRNGANVVINVARWVKGVPRYGAPLSVYRQYVVNHEVGHRLGESHQRCPRRGGPAPVMQQQTLGLHGCTANPWPYPDGRLHQGPLGSYNDPTPPRDRGRR
ncbi:DUF3152 domain-containing protein [Actinoplanes sichuanensis]|uniref:DUF3152 domain-containing protein n=1 Tax=Actinoplanes sichuanensis TaxID=512349 RepID=A0ABW4AU32_9ACTN|nr:DUF3152 domain-containing protein [Actinoplanes sichuanensis]BEL04481.1 DUF3152 domain-containing protein [Actinoplanes sichuanensis]